MPIATPPVLTDPGLSPDRSDRATFSARAIALDDFTKNVQIPQLRLALANVSANATDAASSGTSSANSAASSANSATNAANQVTLAANQVMLATAEKNAAASSALTAAQSAALPGWVTGTNYSTGQRAISLISGRAYLSLSAGVSTVDPINDTARWRLITVNRPVVLVTTTAQTASAGSHYVMTNPALTSLTLPASPVSGDEVEITFANGRADNLVLRNGKGLLVNNDGSILLEDLVFDSPNSTLTLAYAENAWRFKTEGSGLAISDSAGATAIAIRNAEEATALALRNSTEAASRIARGYEVPVTYTAGISLTRATQTVSHMGVVYAPALADLPFTTSGTFEAAKFRVIQGVAGADLADGAGAALVGSLNTGAGAVLRTVQAKLRDNVNAEDFGAVGDNTSNDTSSIQAAISSLGVLGGRVNLGNRTYKTDAALTISKPIQLLGEGGIYSGINPSGVGVSVVSVLINPDAGYDQTLSSIQGLTIGNPNNGLRAGAQGILALTLTAGQLLPKLTLRDVSIGQGSSWAFQHINDLSINVTGGLYGARFENCTFKGGVNFDGSGDSNTIAHCIISGAKIGVCASLISGASLLSLDNLNITNDGGAVRLDNGNRWRITNGNFENIAPGAAAQNNAAVVNITGDNGVMVGGVIKDTLVSAFGTSNATALLRLSNQRGARVENVVFLNGGSATTGILIEASCQNTIIGPCTFNAAVTAQVVDNGIGTMGLLKTATLVNGWVGFAGAQSLQFIKDQTGVVHIFGSIASGTTANGTIITTLPDGFWPSGIVRRSLMQSDGLGVPTGAHLSVESNGTIRINLVTASNQLFINFTFPAANLGNATSLE